MKKPLPKKRKPKLHRLTALRLIDHVFDFSFVEGNKSTPSGAWLARALMDDLKLTKHWLAFCKGHDWRAMGKYRTCANCGKEKKNVTGACKGKR